MEPLETEMDVRTDDKCLPVASERITREIEKMGLFFHLLRELGRRIPVKSLVDRLSKEKTSTKK